MRPKRPHLAVVALGGWGGSSIAALEIAHAMSALADVSIVAPRPIRRALTSRLRRLDHDGADPVPQRLATLHRQRPLDAIHVHFLSPLLGACLRAVAAWPAPRPTVSAIAHGSDVAGPSAAPLPDAATRHVARWIAPSQALAARAGSLEPQRPFEIIPNGVDLTRFRPRSLL
ncbi:MAG: glycosyltransferase, partial [Planctomycetota bacterium]